MSSKKASDTIPFAVNASVLALVILLAGMLYLLGVAMSGDTKQLSESVRGAIVIDTRDL